MQSLFLFTGNSEKENTIYLKPNQKRQTTRNSVNNYLHILETPFQFHVGLLAELNYPITSRKMDMAQICIDILKEKRKNLVSKKQGDKRIKLNYLQ